MTPNKYTVAMVQLLLIVVTALQAAMAGGITETEVWQLAGIVVGAVVTVFAPLVQGNWVAALKVLGAVIGAGIAAIVPFVTDGWTPEAAVIVVLAVLNTFATQIGVNMRVDSVRATLADPTKDSLSAEVVDPAAAQAARNHTTWQL